MARIPAVKFAYTPAEGADFHVVYWAPTTAGPWDYDNTDHGISMDPVIDATGDHVINLADYVPHDYEGQLAVKIVSGQGDPTDLTKAILSNWSEVKTGTVDFLAPAAPTNLRFL